MRKVSDSHLPMNVIDSIQHDLLDANLSLTTAIELLSSMEQDGGQQNLALHELIDQLCGLKDELDAACQRVVGLQQHR